MARKTFSTTLDEKITKDFKDKCDQDKIAYNDMLEMLIELYLTDQIKLRRDLEININK